MTHASPASETPERQHYYVAFDLPITAGIAFAFMRTSVISLGRVHVRQARRSDLP